MRQKNNLYKSIAEFVVDRVEEGTAVIELPNREMLSVPSWMFPWEVAEGDVFTLGEGLFNLTKITPTRQQAERESVDDLFASLRKPRAGRKD